MPFIKLDAQILTSTLWMHPDARNVFLTALLMAEPHELTEPTPQLEVSQLRETGWLVPPGWYGFVPASGPGIVRQAIVEHEIGIRALERLAAPEPESRSQEHEGRRMVRVNGGYVVLNYFKFRDKDHTTKFRSKRYRDRLKETASRRDVTRDTRVNPVTSRIARMPLPLPSSGSDPEGVQGEGIASSPPEPPSSPSTLPQVASEAAPAPLDGVTQVNPRKGRFVPADFQPNDTHRMRCQELRFDVADLLRRFRLQEFNREYSDWDKRFSIWIEEQKIRNETESARPKGKAAPVEAEPHWTVRHILQTHRTLCQEHGLGDPEKLARAWVKILGAAPATIAEGERGFTRHLRALAKQKRAEATP